MCALEVSVVKQFESFELEVDFSVESGVLVLFGPSGAGKSLTIQMIAGLMPPDQGVIRIDNQELFNCSSGVNLRPQHRHIGYVPQNYAVFPHLTVAENIAFPLYKGHRRLSKKQALIETRSLLEQFRLAERAEAKASELSGGQLQRIALARALVTQPRALLLDEPFAALDAPVKRELRNEFRRFQQEDSIPTVFITHDIEEAATVADEIAILIDGHIRQFGPTRDVLDYPADGEIAELVQARNVLSGTLERQDEKIIALTPVGELATEVKSIGESLQVTVVIRPEKIRIIRDDSEISQLLQENLLTGTISDVRDHGTYTAVVCNVQAGTLEVSLSPTAAVRLNIGVGKPVRLSIPPTWIHIIT